ncbi:hypothetical protein PAMP_013077 [Pampus punctatissimus]
MTEIKSLIKQLNISKVCVLLSYTGYSPGRSIVPEPGSRNVLILGAFLLVPHLIPVCLRCP